MLAALLLPLLALVTQGEETYSGPGTVKCYGDYYESVDYDSDAYDIVNDYYEASLTITCRPNAPWSSYSPPQVATRDHWEGTNIPGDSGRWRR